MKCNGYIIWTNEDGAEFKTGWVGADDGILVYDANQDGVSQANEFTSIIDSTVESIYLTSDGVQSIVEGNSVYGNSYYLDSHGDSYTVADVGLQIQDVLDSSTIDSDLDASLPENISSLPSNESSDVVPENNTIPMQDVILSDNTESPAPSLDFGV